MEGRRPVPIVDQAIWIVERNSATALTLPGLAETCGVSRAHLANAFATATGIPVMTYVRGRRLSVAARALADGARDILSVALDAGYGSHEAFTRAFRDQMGLTPEQVRARGDVHGLPVVEAIRPQARPLPAIDPPRFVHDGRLRAVGLAETCGFDSTMTIPAQWQRFMADAHAIPARLDRIPIGVCEGADEDGRFRYVCAVEVARFERTPAGLVELDLPPCEYAVFEHRGHVSTIFDTYAAIWNQALPAAGRTAADAPTIERHADTFDPHTGEGGLSLWIPLDAPR